MSRLEKGSPLITPTTKPDGYVQRTILCAVDQGALQVDGHPRQMLMLSESTDPDRATIEYEDGTA